MFEEKYESMFIVRTPYHYINALEAANKYKVDLEKSILIVWSNHFKKRFKHMLRGENWGRIEYLPVVHYDKKESWFRGVKNAFKDVKYLLKSGVVVSRVGRVEKCFSIIPVEKYLQHIINKVEAKKLVIIDEGIGVFSLTKKYLEKRKGKTEVKSLRYDRRRKNAYEFFTSYPIEKYVEGVSKKRIKRNEFRMLKSKSKTESNTSKCGLILGTERNERTKNIYTKFLNESINFMKNKANKIWYKPHRMETDNQIEKVKDVRGVKIMDNEYPIEIALTREKTVPKYVAGFASTAIHSILKVYEKEVEKVVVFGRKGDIKEEKTSYEYYESMDDEKVNVIYV